jgi:hypothetical protein
MPRTVLRPIYPISAAQMPALGLDLFLGYVVDKARHPQPDFQSWVADSLKARILIVKHEECDGLRRLHAEMQK